MPSGDHGLVEDGPRAQPLFRLNSLSPRSKLLVVQTPYESNARPALAVVFADGQDGERRTHGRVRRDVARQRFGWIPQLKI